MLVIAQGSPHGELGKSPVHSLHAALSFLVPCPVKSNHLGLPGLAAPSPQFREDAGGRLGPPPWMLPMLERILQITTGFFSFKHYGLSFLGFLFWFFFFTFLITDLFIYFLNFLLLEYSRLTKL